MLVVLNLRALDLCPNLNNNVTHLAGVSFFHPEPYSKERKNKNKNKNRAYLYGSVWCRIKLAISLTLRLANPGTGNRHILGDKKETNMLDSNREIALKVAPKPKNFAFPRHAFILV